MKLHISPLAFLLASLLSTASAQMVPLSATASYSPATLTSDLLTYQLHVQEVNLVLTVADSKGHFVQNLLPSDLRILDNNKQQNLLTFFQRETNLPLDVALVVDTSASVSYRFQTEQDALNTFLRKVVRPADSVMLFAFNQRVQMAASIERNWKQVSAQVSKLRPDGDTAIYDAVCAASQWLAHDHRPARRLMILISDGEENASTATLDDAIGQALKSETAIYSVNVRDENLLGDDGQGEQVLKRLSDATGGMYMRAHRDGDVGPAFRKIERELRSQYAVAYRPSNFAEQLFHHIQIVAPRNLRVRCRTGYYAKATFTVAK